MLGRGLVCLAALASAACSSDDGDEPAETSTVQSALSYEAGSSTFCVTDSGRGFDPTAGIADGQRVLIVEAWYPTTAAAVAGAARATFGDYFSSSPELLARTERALLQTTGFAADVVEQHMLLAPEQFEVERNSYRNAPVAEGSFPVVLYSHGTLQQRFTNDAMAESLARRGYIVLAPEHTGNDSLAPLGSYCQSQMSAPGVMSPALDTNTAFDRDSLEYRGQTFDPFFLAGDAAPGGTGTINPVEVSLTLDRVDDYRATLAALAGGLGEVSSAADPSRVGLVGYSRGAMHGLVGAELIPEIKASVALVGGTPLRFYASAEQAAPINAALAQATGGARTSLSELTKPVVDIIGGEDSRRKATTDVAAGIGMYETPSATNPSPIVADSFETSAASFTALVNVPDIDHFDLVDDPFVVAYRAQGGITRTGAFDSGKSYSLRPLAERQAIRDHYVLATFDRFLKELPASDAFTTNPFAAQGVTVTLGE